MSITKGRLSRHKGKNFFINILPISFGATFLYKDTVKPLSGTVTIGDDSDAVVGVLTEFTKELKVGDMIKIMGADFGAGVNEATVATIVDDTNLTVTPKTGVAGGSAEAKIYTTCPTDEKFIPIDIKKDLGLQVIHLVTGMNEDGFSFMYHHGDKSVKAFLSGGTEAEILDPDAADDGDELQDTDAIIVAIGR